MPGGAGRAAAQGPRGPSVRTPAAGHGVGRCCPAPSAPRPDPGRRPKSGGGGGRGEEGAGLTGPRSTSGAPQRPGLPSLPAGVARVPGRRGPRLGCLREWGATVPTNRRCPEQSGGWVVLGDSPPPSLDRGARSGARRKDPSRAAPCERPGRHCLRPAPPPPRRTPQPERRGRPRLCPRPPRTPARSLRDRRRGRRHPPPRRRGARPADSFPTRASPSGETGAGTSGRKWALRSGDRPSGPLHRALSPGRSGERRGPFPPHIPKGQKDRLKDRRPAATP